MQRKLLFTKEAEGQLLNLQKNNFLVHKQVLKTLGLLETNLRHPSLQTHEYSSITGKNGEKIWEAYVQNQTSSAYRIFFHYGPDLTEKGKRIPILTVVAITPHP